MNIHGVFKLIFKCFNFGFLIEKILLFETNFSSELINASDLLLNAHKFIPLICKIRSESIELFLFIFVINLTFSKVGIWEFNFFIKNSQLLISFDKLMVIWIYFMPNNQRIRNSIVAIIPACHAGDPSSILGCGGFFLLL